MTLENISPKEDTAAEFQSWLDWMDAAVLGDDFDTYASGVALPFALATQAETMIITRLDDLRKGFDAYCEMLRAQGATEIIRVAQGVFRMGDGMMSGTYETHILKRGARVLDPFASTAILRRGDTCWQAVAIGNAMTNVRWPIDLPRLGRGTRS